MRERTYLWWFERIICWKVYCEKKYSPLICTIRLGKKTKQTKHINILQLFWSFPSEHRQPPKAASILENPFSPQYTAHSMGCVLGRHSRKRNLPLAYRSTIEPTRATTLVAQCSYWVLPFLGKEREGAVFDWWTYKTADPPAPPHQGEYKTQSRSSKSCLRATPQLLWSSSILKLQIYLP